MDVSKTHTTNTSLKWLIILIAILSIALLSYPAKGESINITVSNDTRANYIDPRTSTSQILATHWNYSYFLFDTVNYSTLTNYTIRDSFNAMQFAYPNEVTTFTITVNGTGHGIASYSQFLHQLQWVFSPDTVITGSPFNLTYANDIFNNVTYTGGGNLGEFSKAPAPASSLSAGAPMYPGNLSYIMSYTFTGAAYEKWNMSGIFSSGTVTNHFDFTYPFAGYYLTTVTKSGQSVGTK